MRTKIPVNMFTEDFGGHQDTEFSLRISMDVVLRTSLSVRSIVIATVLSGIGR